MPEIYQKQRDNQEQPPEEVIDAIKALFEYCEREDEHARKVHLYEAKMADLYWHGFQHLYWDGRNEEFRIPTHQALVDAEVTRDEAEYMYDYVTNIFKAHGLSIIAAIGAETPTVLFSPGDTNDPIDYRAAQKAEKLARIIHQKNNSKMDYLHALFIMFTQHIVAGYNYYDRSKKYGTLELPVMGTKKVQVVPPMNSCPECEFATESPMQNCPDCGAKLKNNPAIEEDQSYKKGIKKIYKGFPKLAIYGVINVKVPSLAVDQDSCGYLIKYTEQPTAYLQYLWNHLRGKLTSSDSDSWEKSARAPSITSRMDEYNPNYTELKEGWFRPWQYEGLEEVQAQFLYENYPDGLYAALASRDVFAEARGEDLDDYWTITKSDLSRTIHGDPGGKIALQQQDIENLTDNLLLESLVYSIPMTFAEPQVFGFDEMSKQEVKPGMIYPGKKPPGYTNLREAFAEIKTSTLPKEGVDLQKMNTEKVQFLLASFPSIFGGPQRGGSKTLGEYEKSRNFALQRLAIPGYFMSYFWSQITYKAVKIYIKELFADSKEKYTTPTFDGRYETITIFKDDFNGKFELFVPESSGEVPVTFGQKRQFLMEAFQLNSPDINSFLFSPNNIRVIMRYFNLGELVSEDETQVSKIMMDISEMLQPNGIFIAPDPEIDDDEIQLTILKNFLAGPGQDFKIDNPEGFNYCLQRAKIHKQNLMMQMQMQQQQEAPPKKEKVNNNGSY